MNRLDVLARRDSPLVMLTAYDVAGARLAEAAGVDLLLVGDSAGMVVLGQPDTTAVTLEDMVGFTRAVATGAERVPIVSDLPRGSYEAEDALAVRSARRLVEEGGAQAVKLEGGGPMGERVRAITAAGIPVFGHLGLTPQSVEALGGFRAQARTGKEAGALLADARRLEAAGAVALVLEAIPPDVATAVTDRIGIPTIGIGAGPGTTGQVLVYHDLLGLGGARVPRFVRQYADLAPVITGAIREWAADVRAGRFPAAEHTYPMPAEQWEAFARTLGARERDG